MPTLEEKIGYIHGWYTAANGGTQITSLSNTSSNINLYERLIPNTYTVAFNANAPTGKTPSGSMTSQSFTYDQTQALTENGYSVEGYDFVGWNTKADGSGENSYENKQSVSNLTYVNNGTVTLYAQWEEKGMEITYHPNATGTTGTMDKQKIPLGTTQTPLAKNKYINTNKAFIKWTTNADGTGTSYTDGQNVSFETKGTMDLYAQWDEAGVKITKIDSSVNYYHNIKEALDENSGTAMTITLLMDDTSTVNIPANTTLNLNGLTWTPGGNVTNNGKIIGTGTIAGTATVTNSGTIQNVTLNVPKVTQGTTLGTGGTLDGGTVSASTKVILGTVKGTIENNGDIIGSVVSGASISNNKPKFIVQFSDNGNAFTNAGTSEVYKYQVITSGEKVTAPTEPKANGVLFVKWGKTGADNATEWDYESDTITENTTIYAIWETHTHGWTYDAADDTLYAWCNGNERCPYHGTSKADAPLTLKIAASNKTYSGSAYNSDASNPDITITNAITDATNEATGAVIYYKAGADGTKTGAAISAPVDAGNYVAEISIAGKTAAAAFTIEPKTITSDMIQLDSSGNRYSFTSLLIEPVLTVTDDAVTLTAGEGNDYTCSGQLTGVSYGTYEMTVTGRGNYKGTQTVTWYITDPNAPTGKITIDTKSWNTFADAFAFDTYYRQTQTVTITAEDGALESGVDKVYYYKASETLDADAVRALDTSVWTEIANGGSFDIDPDAELVIYAKLMDKSGNTTFISSDGLVLDGNAPSITGVTDGKTYCEAQTVTVTDKNLDKVTINGTEETLTDKTCTLAADGTTYTIAATDKAGNHASVTVTVNGKHTWTEPVFTWSEDLNSATATFTCKHDKTHTHPEDCVVTSKVTKEATGTEKGELTYTATVSFAGKTYTDTMTAETALTGKEEVGDGIIVAEVIVAQDVPKTVISGFTVAMAKTLLTQDELVAAEGGADITVYLETTNINDTVSGTDKALVEEKLGLIVDSLLEDAGLTKREEVNTGIRYIDLSLYKKVGDGEAVKLSNTGSSAVTVTVSIPEDMKSTNEKRTYHIIRVHNENGANEVDVLPAVHEKEAGTLTFTTDRFSTYAIAYSEPQAVDQPAAPDAEVEPAAPEKTPNPDKKRNLSSPATGDATEPLYWMMIMLLSLGAVVFVRRKKEDKQ